MTASKVARYLLQRTREGTVSWVSSQIVSYFPVDWTDDRDRANPFRLHDAEEMRKILELLGTFGVLEIIPIESTP